MARYLEYLFVRGMLALLRFIPYTATLGLARAIAHTAHRFNTTPRERAISNLSLVFGDAMSDARKEGIVRGIFETIARHVAEVAHLTEQATRGVRVENADILKSAYAQGRGVVLVSAHMGCFVRMVTIPHLLGVRAAVIMKKQRNEKLLEWAIGHLKRHFDLDVIVKKEARDRVVTLLQEGRVVGFFADQHPRKGGFPARFFGRDITAAAGPVIYAQRFGCPLVVFTAVLLPDGTHLLRFDGPVSTDGSPDEVSQRWLDLLEARIREYPEQWMWMHRRWRGAAAERRLTPAPALSGSPSHP